jgi:hypothetical protein
MVEAEVVAKDINDTIRDGLMGRDRVKESLRFMGTSLLSSQLAEPDPVRVETLVLRATTEAIQGLLKSYGMDPERCPKITGHYEDGKVHVDLRSDDLEVMALLFCPKPKER